MRAPRCPTSLIDAARVDGAGEFRIFTRVAVPLLVPGMVTIFLFQFVAIWNNFFLPLIVLNDPNALSRQPGAGDLELRSRRLIDRSST